MNKRSRGGEEEEEEEDEGGEGGRSEEGRGEGGWDAVVTWRDS